MSQRHKTTKKTQKKSTVKRLLVANLIAAIGLVTVTVTVLFCLGLLDSIFAFLF